MTGKERVLNIINGKKPDRQPHYDILRNDDIIEYITGEKLTFENAERVAHEAVAKCLDSTRGIPKLPSEEREAALPDGRKVLYKRWTRWIEHKKYGSVENYTSEKEKLIADKSLSPEEVGEVQRVIGYYAAYEREHFRDIAFFWNMGGHSKEQFGFQGNGHVSMIFCDIFTEIGLEDFSYYLFENSSIISEIMEYNTLRSIEAVKLIPDDTRPFGVIYADDLAFKSGPMVNPSFYEKEYFPRLKRLIEAFHEKDIKVLFHSDGNLYKILDGIVDAGIDFLNPLETAAGMEIKEVHRKYPGLIIAGGIDASQLLPFGTEKEVKDAVKKAVDEAEGRILVGSTTEMNEMIPVKNFIALQEALWF